MAHTGAFRLPKSERLRHKRAFKYLFEHGSSLRVGVLKFFYAHSVPAEFVEAPLSIAVTAPKRAFKKAVTRNLLKRRMREAYRLHKIPLQNAVGDADQCLIILVKFQGYYPAPYHRIVKDMVRGLEQLERKMAKA